MFLIVKGLQGETLWGYNEIMSTRKGREGNVLDGPGFGKGVGELLSLRQRQKIRRLGIGAVGVAAYLTRHAMLARRIANGDEVDPIEARRHSDSYRRLRGGKQTVKHRGRPPRSVWEVQGSGLDEPWGGMDQKGTVMDP